MAVSLVQHVHAISFSQNGDVTLTFSAASTSGNLLVLFSSEAANADDQPPWPSSGWTTLYHEASGYNHRIGVKVSTGETSVTLPSTDTAYKHRMSLLEFSGAETTDLDRAVVYRQWFQAAADSIDATITAGPYTPEFDSGYLLAFYIGLDARAWKAATRTLSNGFSFLYEQNTGSNQPYVSIGGKSNAATSSVTTAYNSTGGAGGKDNYGVLLHIKEPNSIDPVNRVLNGTIVQDRQAQARNLVMNGLIFQEKAAAAAAPAPGSAETWIWHKIEQGVYSEPGASMGGVLIE